VPSVVWLVLEQDQPVEAVHRKMTTAAPDLLLAVHLSPVEGCETARPASLTTSHPQTHISGPPACPFLVDPGPPRPGWRTWCCARGRQHWHSARPGRTPRRTPGHLAEAIQPPCAVLVLQYHARRQRQPRRPARPPPSPVRPFSSYYTPRPFARWVTQGVGRIRHPVDARAARAPLSRGRPARRLPEAASNSRPSTQ